jgi:hypothetical protein
LVPGYALADLDLDRKLSGGGDDQRLRRLAAAELRVGVTLQKSVQNPAIKTTLLRFIWRWAQHIFNRFQAEKVQILNLISAV